MVVEPEGPRLACQHLVELAYVSGGTTPADPSHQRRSPLMRLVDWTPEVHASIILTGQAEGCRSVIRDGRYRVIVAARPVGQVDLVSRRYLGGEGDQTAVRRASDTPNPRQREPQRADPRPLLQTEPFPATQ